MSHYRPHSPPHQPIKLNSRPQKHNKSHQNTPNIYGVDSGCSQKRTNISSKSDDEYETQINSKYYTETEDQVKTQLQLNQVRKKLSKQEQKNFIYQHFFKKIQKILYSQNSEHLADGDIKNYQKLQYHLSDMVKRIQKGSQYNKLAAVPVIYKKNNTTTIMTTNVKPRSKK